MSRIIVKNIPAFVEEQQLKEHFKDLGEITDCKIAKTAQGKTRKFGFIGFKDKNSGKLALKNYNNTYIGVSKVKVQLAKTIDSDNSNQTKKINKHNKQEINSQKFEQYKKIVQEGVKKSWNDLIITQQSQIIPKKQNTKKQRKQQKKQSKQLKNKNSNTQIKQEIEEKVKPIRAPKLSQKNKKYMKKQLGIDNNRLYITNIPYQISEDEIKEQFKKFGNVIKIKLPRQYDGKTKGFVFVTFSLPQQAMRAFSKTHNKIVFGRILHVRPAIEDIGQIIKNGKEKQFQENLKQRFGQSQQQKTSYKKRKKKQMRQKLNDTTSWNTLFLNPNTVLQRVSKKLGITKSQILLSEDLAPKVALAEAEIINQTKEWMINQNLNIEFLDIDRNLCERSQKIILIKNLNYNTSQNDLKLLFQFYGIVNRVLLSPNKAIAIVQYQNKQFAINAFEQLQNHKFKNNFLFLQYAPIGMMHQTQINDKMNKLSQQKTENDQLSKIIYVKNLNFSTIQEQLSDLVKNIQQPKSVKIIRDRANKSMGYGFLEFSSHQIAEKIIKKYQNSLIDGHRIMFSMSKKQSQAHKFEKIKELKNKLNDLKKQKGNNKLLIKNIAFQATKHQIRQLFRHYGSLSVVRLPKKMDGQHRGFAFVEYQTLDDAALAKQALSNAHMYGRKLVVEYAKNQQF